MKKTETIALYKEAFLAGKPEDVRRKFEEKDVEKQYSSIIAWRRRQRKSSVDAPEEEKMEKQPLTPTSILESLREIKNTIPTFDELPHEMRDQLLSVLGEITSDIHNFDRIKKSQLLSKLESEQEEINRQRDTLQQRIDSLRQELSWQ
ncbi:MAG: hypothetical protein K2H46_08735 [Muribaculaceae bacterium]|nr:hypothetical protein [Muribaculaceae bacterium]